MSEYYVYTILQEVLDGGDINLLVPFLGEMDDDLFHQLLSSRCVRVLRLVMDQNKNHIHRISPEQLDFFTSYGPTLEEKQHAYELGKVLIDYGYVFGTDETSVWFQQAIMDNFICIGNMYYKTFKGK